MPTEDPLDGLHGPLKKIWGEILDDRLMKDWFQPSSPQNRQDFWALQASFG
jgi:hypothetical protein